jgi:sigma-E factor negative regulatory protein RseB
VLLAGLLVLAALAVAWPGGAFGTSSPSEAAAQLVERTRQAAQDHDFTGSATVAWRDGGTLRRTEVAVTDASGAIEARVGGNVVYDSGARTYVKDGRHWTGIAVGAGAPAPSPAAHWRLAVRNGGEVAGRTTDEVVATRADGTVAERLAVDVETGLLLARQVVDRDGRVERSLEFTEITVAPATTTVTAPAGVRTERSSSLAKVPDGYVAPASLGAAALVARAKEQEGVVFSYSDGLFSTTVFEQRGTLDWGSLPGGGADAQLHGAAVRRWSEPSGTVLVWERDGVVYTCVSDAPADVFQAAVEDLTGSGRSALQRAADFVLGPFGWN